MSRSILTVSNDDEPHRALCVWRRGAVGCVLLGDTAGCEARTAVIQGQPKG